MEVIDTATDLILWQWPVKVIITVAFYAFALKGLERLVRSTVSFGLRLKRFAKDSEAVDYSVRRLQRRGTSERSQALWQMFTWWITQYGQRQREPLEVRVLDMPTESRSGMRRPFQGRAADFGPDESAAPDEPNGSD